MFNFITSKFFDFNVFINYIEDKNMTTLSAINQKYITVGGMNYGFNC